MYFFKKICDGDGKCLIPCPCDCPAKCKCIHKNHYGWCPNTCCELIECRNFDDCRNKMPLWILKEFFKLILDLTLLLSQILPRKCKPRRVFFI